jgi:glycosyltransferase involved in cell wall biosynthesis
MPDGAPWPRLSIITPNYNRQPFLEEAIRAVLLQGYPNLEYLVIDGASTDGSLDIIRRYEPWIAKWISAPDTGAAQAVNRGLRMVTGSLFGLALSDDRLCPGALRLVGEAHARQPRMVVAGDVIDVWVGSDREELVRQEGIDLPNMVEFWKRKAQFHTPGLFIPTAVSRSVGFFDETLFGEDYDYLCRVLAVARVHYLRQPVVTFRRHPGGKTSGDTRDLGVREFPRVSRRYWHLVPGVDVAGHRRYWSGTIFCLGIHRLLRRRSQWWQFVAEGFQIHPFWSIYAAMRRLPSWILKRAVAGRPVDDLLPGE